MIEWKNQFYHSIMLSFYHFFPQWFSAAAFIEAAISAGDFFFLSGQIATDAAQNIQLFDGDLSQQLELILKNIF